MSRLDFVESSLYKYQALGAGLFVNFKILTLSKDPAFACLELGTGHAFPTSDPFELHMQ